MTIARLTAALDRPAKGRVHSCFGRTVNVAFGTQARLLTLVAPGLPRLPDSVEWPTEAMERLRPGDEAALTEDCLTVGTRMERLVRDSWDGSIPRYGVKLDAAAFLALTGTLESGLDRLPSKLRRDAERAIVQGDASLVGLGIGLTPSFDDACVAAMALRRALGVPGGFENLDVTRTTDVSARYLTLAAQGHFGQALCDVMAALFGQGDLERAVSALAGFGATSGRDMLRGLRLMMENGNYFTT